MIHNPFRVSQGKEILLFLRRWLANPMRIGAVLPSSPSLTRLIARHAVTGDDGAVLELGPGTGAVTQAMLDAGITEDRLILVEIDPKLHHWLARRFPKAMVIHGDAAELQEILPQDLIGQISTVVSSLPILSFPLPQQRAIVEQVFGVTSADGRLLQYTYSPNSPFSRGLVVPGKLLGWAPGNVPPASLWRFTRPEVIGNVTMSSAPASDEGFPLIR
ncbi:MAG: rRNA adenine N-6-methyltransferase family protein [Alphaproteobacteria bacterium]